ncbi:hypothetical protein [Clostridioides difficile]|uniref:hypothetical protein n=1 Tax=Clostridioides difficile TaxID=1496 RepID=UPI0023B22422|nr:hypothetical protein [Clostridioides difficile]
MPKIVKASERGVKKTFRMYPETIEKILELQELLKKQDEKITQAKVIDMALDVLKRESRLG